MGWTMVDGVLVPTPEPREMEAFNKWAELNAVKEPLSPLHHYDNVSAFREGLNRDFAGGHFPDTYKLPGHPTFSVESIYYEPGMDAGYWVGDKYVRFGKGQPYENLGGKP